MTRVIFHLGDKKTGSTAIQTAIAAKAWTCDTVSLLYPGNDRVNHIALAKSLHRRLGARDTTRRHFSGVANEIRKHNPDVAVISAEDFEDVDPEILKEAVEKFMPEYAEGAQYMAYVRPHAERLASSYAERVKAGGVMETMDELYTRFHNTRMLVYRPRFERWRTAFGAAFVLRPMIRELLYQQDVVQDFLQFALQTDDFSVIKVPNANESVSLENLAILHSLQQALRSDDTERNDVQPAFGRYVARYMNRSAFSKGTKVQFHRALAERMVADCMMDATKLDAGFFSGTPMADALRMAPSKAVDLPQSIALKDHYSDREQFLIGLWVHQISSFVRSGPDELGKLMRTEQREVVMGTSTEVPEEERDPITGLRMPKRRETPRPAAGRGPGRKQGGKGAAVRAELAEDNEDGAASGGQKGGAGRLVRAKGPGGKGGGKAGAGPRAGGGPNAGGVKAGGPNAGGPKAGGPNAGGLRANGPKAGGPRAGGPKAGGLKAGGPNAGGRRLGGPNAGGGPKGGGGGGGGRGRAGKADADSDS